MINVFLKYLSFIFLCLLPFAASAQEAEAPLQDDHDKNYLSFSYENDLIGGGTDQFYTSGVRATWFNANTRVPGVIDDLAEYVPIFDINPTTGTFFTLGQTIFTPENIRSNIPQSDDRPWAGFLYGSVGLATRTGDHVDELEITLGVVGPESLGEQTQKFIHENITNSPDPEGWDNQLDFEPGLILSWQRRWPQAGTYTVSDYILGAQPHVNISLGNVYTYAGSGLTFTLGPRDQFQDTPPRVRPAMPGSGYFESPMQGGSWQLFAGIEGRAMARNIFLDGNSFSDSPRIDKELLMGDAVAGLSITMGDYRLAYSYNIRTAEFKGQDSESTFGSLTLTARF